MAEVTPIPHDAPVMIAWAEYKSGEDFKDTMLGAKEPGQIEGSLWASFYTGYASALDASVHHELVETLDGFGSSGVRDRIAKHVGCNHDLLHEALRVEVRKALSESEEGA